MPFFGYIPYTASLDQYYVGNSENLAGRLFRHTNSGSKATKKAKDWKVVYTEAFDTRTEAFNREMNIKKKKSRNYIVWLIGSPDKLSGWLDRPARWINEIFIKQYQADSADVYNYMKAPSSFVMLIKENKTDIIKDLLFSPNYVTSLNAMEALLFLASTRQVQLSSELINRITQIKNGSFLIMQQGAPDVYYKRKGYKDLQMTDANVE